MDIDVSPDAATLGERAAASGAAIIRSRLAASGLTWRQVPR